MAKRLARLGTGAPIREVGTPCEANASDSAALFVAGRLVERRRVPLDRCTLQDERAVHRAMSTGDVDIPGFNSFL